jgi:hypothetical protein
MKPPTMPEPKVDGENLLTWLVFQSRLIRAFLPTQQHNKNKGQETKDDLICRWTEMW